jgi:hypothetical protein
MEPLLLLYPWLFRMHPHFVEVPALLEKTCKALAKLSMAGSAAISLLLLVLQEGLHHLNIDACGDQAMRVLVMK